MINGNMDLVESKSQGHACILAMSGNDFYDDPR